jgi:hypothetical protein
MSHAHRPRAFAPNTIHDAIAGALASLVIASLPACSGDAFRYVPADAGERAPGPRLSVPTKPDGGSTPPRTGRPEQVAPLAFALHVAGDVVAFDPETGTQLGRYVFGRDLEDVCWDARTGRVLIVEHDAWADGSRVHALHWGGREFVHEASSPLLPGHTRVFAASDRVFAVSEEQGVVWNVLDDDLAPVGHFEPLSRPVSLFQVESSAPSRLLALDSSAELGGRDADQLLGIEHPGGDWEITRQLYPAPGRPSARLVPGDSGSAYLLHKLPGEGTIELAQLSTSAPEVPPELHVAMTGAGGGQLGGATYDPERRLVVVALSTVPMAWLALVPTETGRATSLTSLGTEIPNRRWWPRDLVRDPATGRILAATTDGLRAFLPEGNAAQPALVADAAFAAPELRGPIVLAR